MVLFLLMAALSAAPRMVPVESVGGRELSGRVLTISVPESFPASHGTLRWVTGEADEIRQQSILIRPGYSVVEMRGVPGWQGKLRQAALVLPPAMADGAGSMQCSIAPPAWGDELEIATQTRPIELTLINKATPRAIGGGWQIQHLTIALAAGGLIAGLALRRLPIPAAVLLGGIAALSLVEVRESLDRWSLAAAGRPASVPGLEGVWAFEERAASELSGQTWAMVAVDSVRKYQLLYSFAEQPYVFDPQKARVIVTARPVLDPLLKADDLSLVRGPADE